MQSTLIIDKPVNSSPALRWLLGLMQLKDTLAIALLLSNFMLIFGILGGVGIPGLVLYGMRWRQLRQVVPLRRVAWVAGLSWLHEVAWAYTFWRDQTRAHYGGESGDDPLPHYAGLYAVGALLCAGQLLVLAWQAWGRPTGGLRRQLVASVLWTLGLAFGWLLVANMLRTLVPSVGTMPVASYRTVLWLQVAISGLVLAGLAYCGVGRLLVGIWAHRATARWPALVVAGLLLLYQGYGLLWLHNLLAYTLNESRWPVLLFQKYRPY